MTVTAYAVDDGPEKLATVVLEGQRPKRRRRCLRDRIAKMNLDLINSDLAAAFDNPVWFDIDPAPGPDLTAIWEAHAGTVAANWKSAAKKSGVTW